LNQGNWFILLHTQLNQSHNASGARLVKSKFAIVENQALNKLFFNTFLPNQLVKNLVQKLPHFNHQAVNAISVNHIAILVNALHAVGVYSFLFCSLLASKSFLACAKSLSVRFAGTVQYLSCT
jgi:hypothetical protein